MIIMKQHRFRLWLLGMICLFLLDYNRIHQGRASNLLFQLEGQKDWTILPPLLPIKPASPNPDGGHNPRRFSTNITLNIRRGLNIINAWSGQQMAAWIYTGREKVHPSYLDTWSSQAETLSSKFLRYPNDTTKLQSNDTLFVAHAKLEEFVSEFLPHITVDIVLISVAFRMDHPTLEWVTPRAIAIVQHPHILTWYSNNIHCNFTGSVFTQQLNNSHKIHSFPLGLKPNLGKAAFRNPLPHYRRAFLTYHNHSNVENNNSNKTSYNATHIKSKTLYISPMRPTNPIRELLMPYAVKILPYPAYLREIMTSQYVLSLNGIFPDCHRHYEALGLGAIPLTQLPSKYFEHLMEAGPIIYDDEQREWSNLSKWQSNLPVPPPIQVNRNMVTEEYYMEYVERTTGRALRWWDVVTKQRSFMTDFSEGASNDLQAAQEKSR